MPRPQRIVVNAIPLCNIATGISRYLRSLYTELERQYSGKAEFLYFDGEALRRTMPAGPQNLRSWSRLADVFWRLPPRVAYAIRLALHARRARRFRRLTEGCALYHEAAFFPFATAAGCATAFTVQDMSLARFPEHHPRERVLYFNKHFAKSLDGVDAFLSISQFTKDELTALTDVPAERVRVTPLAPDTSLFFPRPDSAHTALRTRYGLPERFALFVGSGDPRKNMQVIPRALAAAGLSLPLVVAGWDGWQDSPPGGVIPLGYIDDETLATAYSAATMTVLPSTYEGFGLPVLEAMACGCPVITTRCASLPEVGGDAAVYFDPPDNAPGLGEAMGRIAEDTAHRKLLIEAGYDRAAQFTWERTARLTWDGFTAALEQS